MRPSAAVSPVSPSGRNASLCCCVPCESLWPECVPLLLCHLCIPRSECAVYPLSRTLAARLWVDCILQSVYCISVRILAISERPLAAVSAPARARELAGTTTHGHRLQGQVRSRSGSDHGGDGRRMDWRQTDVKLTTEIGRWTANELQTDCIRTADGRTADGRTANGLLADGRADRRVR